MAVLAVMHHLRSFNVENLHEFGDEGLRALVQQHGRSLQRAFLFGTSVSGSEINHALRKCTQLCKLSHSTGGVDYSLMGRMVLLAIDDVYLDSAACRTMVQACHKMEELHVQCFTLLDALIYQVVKVAPQLHGLRSLHLLCSPGCLGKNNSLERLRALRPTLQVYVRTTRAWGDFFSIPI